MEKKLNIEGVDVYSKEFISFLSMKLHRDIDYPPDEYNEAELWYGKWDNNEDELTHTPVYEHELLPIIEEYKQHEDTKQLN